MSSIYVDKIQAATGNTVSIPAGTSLSLGGTVLSSSSLLPSSSGQNGKILKSNGSTFTFDTSGVKNVFVYTSNGTYTPTSGTRLVYVRIVGAGGGGSGYGESGGSGGYAEGFVSMTGVSNVNITIGNGGSPSYYSGGAGGGSTTSFGSYMTATGGNGANTSHQHCGGLPGLGSGGNLAYYGGGGTGHGYNGRGGGNYWGGAGAAGHPQGGNFNQNHNSHQIPGVGGVNGWATSYPGNTGGNGMIVIWEYS